MKKIILFLMVIFSTSLFATDVSNFDIKGIKLGMSEKELLNILHDIKCKNIKTIVFHVDANSKFPIIKKEYSCKINEFKEEITIDLDHNMNVYEIFRAIELEIEPIWDKIAKNTLKKYGYTKYFNKNHRIISMCWGGCKIDQFGGYYNENGQTFIITFIKPINHPPNGAIDIHLYDRTLLKANILYEDKVKRSLREKSSDIDF